MLAQCRRRWPSITSTLGQCIVLSGVSDAGMLKCHQHNAAVRNTLQSPNAVSMISVKDCGSTLKQHWLNATCLRKVYTRPGDWLVLGQRFRLLPGIDPAMGCNAGPTLNWNLVGRPTFSVWGTSWASIEWMLASTGDGGGRNTRRRYIWTCYLFFFTNIPNIKDSCPWGKPIHWFFVYSTQTD